MTLGKAPDSGAEFEVLPVNVVCEILTSFAFSSSSIGFTIGILSFIMNDIGLLMLLSDVCGNNLVRFRERVKNLDVELVPFQKWKAFLLEKINEPDVPHKKALEGLLLFSSGLPDDRDHKKEIEERSKYVLDHFGPINALYDEAIVKTYFEFIRANKQ